MARGYDGATLEDLLAAMGGIAPPSFYAAFGSKEDLFAEALEYYCATFGEPARQALAGPTVREAIEGMLRQSVKVFLANPAGTRGCLLVMAAMNTTKGNKAAHEKLRTARLQAPEVIRMRIDRAVREGELAAGVNTGALTNFFATVLHGLAIRARDGASRAALNAAVDGAMAAWGPLTSAAESGAEPQLAAPNRSRKAR